MKLFRIAVAMGIGTILLLFSQWPDRRVHLVFCDVGQGDGAIIIKGSFQAVIDTGPSIEKFDNCFSRYVPFWDRKIEAIYISHGHSDHAGALAEINKRYLVEKKMEETKDNDVMRYGNLYIDTLLGKTVVSSKEVLGSNTDNEDSVILEVKYGKFSVLFTGDIDVKAELALVASGVLEQVDVLKVAHHGSKYGSSKEFLDITKPKVAVVSVGAKNSYGHPNGDTLTRLDMVGAKIFRTDKMGTIEIITDGQSYEVRHK